MTKIQQFLADLSEEKKSLFVPVFGSMEKFYTVVYLIARNEHVLIRRSQIVMRIVYR